MYAVHLADLNLAQSKYHPFYWLLAPLLTGEHVPMGNKWVDTLAILNDNDDRFPAIIELLTVVESRTYFRLYYRSTPGGWRKLKTAVMSDNGLNGVTITPLPAQAVRA